MYNTWTHITFLIKGRLQNKISRTLWKVIFKILRTGALIYDGHLFRADLKQTPKGLLLNFEAAKQMKIHLHLSLVFTSFHCIF